MSDFQFINIDQIDSYGTLMHKRTNTIKLADLLNDERQKSYTITNGPLTYNYAHTLCDDSRRHLLQELATTAQAIEKYNALQEGTIGNTTENRLVEHHKTRAQPLEGKYQQDYDAILQYSTKIKKEGKISHVVQIGIGGSQSGPELLIDALQAWALHATITPLQTHFLSSIDPDAVQKLLTHLPFENTLFIIVSKSGSTQETQLNWHAIQQAAKTKGLSPEAFKTNCISITCPGSVLDDPNQFSKTFYMYPEIGGRFSTTSAVGGLITALTYGPDSYTQLLKGAHIIDQAATNPVAKQNICLMSALINIYERLVLEYPVRAIVPYSNSLSKIGLYIQQLICESNGKHCNRDGKPITYVTCPAILPSEGTQAQHAFFQMLHQSNDIIPVQFIGFQASATGTNPDATKALNANLKAQVKALALGSQNQENPRKHFPGNRPSTTLWADTINPETLGALIAYYENTVTLEGFILNINSFDQEGVELGKKLAEELLNN